jgi:hypothetical protein
LRIGIEEEIEAPASADSHVVIALRTHMEVALEFIAIQLSVTIRAFDPYALGYRLGALFGADARWHQFF